MEAITEEDERTNIHALAFELEALKEGIFKRDVKIQHLEGKFYDEKDKSDKLMQLLKLEENRNEEGEVMIQNLKQKLKDTDDLMPETKGRISASNKDDKQDSSVKLDGLRAKTLAGENVIKEIQTELSLWKKRCQDLESQLTTERDVFEEEKQRHEQVKFKLSHSEELLSNFREETFGNNSGENEGDLHHQNIITGLKASIDVQSERNIELHQQLQHLKRDSVDTGKLLKSLKERSEKDQKLIDELNCQNEREYQRNEKLKTDIQHLKRDIDSWRKIQSDMKSQYQDLRSMYDGVCKHADDQKREMLEMKLLMDRDKRSVTRQRDEIDKLKVRVTSFKQTYDDLKEKYDDNFKLLDDKKSELRVLTSQLQSAKKSGAELLASNKDLKKRSDFSQKELIDKHKLLQLTEEKLNYLENSLQEKDLTIKEANKIVKEANDKAERCSQEAATKEKDLIDRVALIQNFQSKMQALEDEVKTQKKNVDRHKFVITEKERIIDDKNKEIKEKESVICEWEERVFELEKNGKELGNTLELAKSDLQRKESENRSSMESFMQQIAEKDHEVQENKKNISNLKEEIKTMRDDNDQKRRQEIELGQKLKDSLAAENEKEKQIYQLSQNLQEEKQRAHDQNELLRELELKPDEDLKIIEYEEKLKKKEKEIDELKLTIGEKDRVMEELKRELEESEIIQVYLNEIGTLNNLLTEERSTNEQLKHKLQNMKLSGSDDVSRSEDDRKEAILQMTKELKREKQTSQCIISDFKEDISVLECNVENEKEKSTILRRDVELKERHMKNERESFLQHIEELQLVLSEAEKENLQNQEKIKKLDSQIRENERQRLNEIEGFENTKHKIISEKNSNLILERGEKVEELKQDLESKKELLDEAERRLVESNKIHEKEQLQVQLVITEKEDLISGLRRENQDLRRRWEKESQWMDENAMDGSSRSLIDKRIEIPSDILKNEANVLASQNIAIQKLKEQIEAEHNLDKIIPLTEHTDELNLDLVNKASSSQDGGTTKTETIKTAIQKLAIVLLLSPLAYFFSCKFFLTFAAVLTPLAFVIHQKPWKNYIDHEKVLSNALNSLSIRLAAESADNDNLRRTINNLTNQGFKEDKKARAPLYNKNNSEIQELEKQSREEQEKQKKELFRIKQKQKGDRRRLQRQQALIDKLEIIMQEKEIKSHLGQFWGYEELKMAINRLKHEREVKKNKSDGTEDAIIQKRVAEVIEEAVGREKKRKFETFAVVVVLSVALILCFTVNSSFLFTLACCVIITSCSVFYGVRAWKEIDYVKYKLQYEKDIVETQNEEIRELSLLMDKEHDVVNKQKQAIEVLERRLNEEYKKNKDHQLTIARLTWVLQEGEEMKNIVQRIKDSPTGMDLKPELQKPHVAEDHAREKFSIFRSMQQQLEEHSSRTEEQRKVIDDLKNASEAIVNTVERQVADIKSQKEIRHDKGTNYFKKLLSWKVILCVLAIVSTLATILLSNKTTALGFPFVFALVFGIFRLTNAKKKGKKLDDFHPKIEKPCLELSISSVKQYVYDMAYVGSLALLSYNIWTLSFHIVVICFGLIVLFRLLTYLAYTRSIKKEIISWNDVVEDLWSQIYERTQLIDVQTEEIQTLKKLLEVERSYNQHAERLLKEAKGISDEGFEELAEVERLKKRADQLQAEDERLVNYELDEMKIFLEEEQRTNVQLRKTLAEVEETKRVLSGDVTHLKRKLDIEQTRRKELVAAKEEESLLKDRIEELMEDLEAEQRTKQELNAQLIEERSSRELKQIELQDLKEKIKDEKHTHQSLCEQVVQLTNKDKESNALRRELSDARQEVEEERLTTQRYNLMLIEATHKLREQNMVLQRQIEDVRSESNHNENFGKIREKSEHQQEEIEQIQSLLEDMTSTKKTLKYQDLIEELQILRRKLVLGEATSPNLLEELELEREKNKILEEAIEELQRQQQVQRKMFEDERRRSIELARQLSGENIPMMVEEDTSEEFEDKRGVLYWLGTNGGLTEWKNPAESGLILISRSSYGHGRATDVSNRKPSWCSTSNKPNQWWKIDFGEKRVVVPTAYSLRHGWSGSAGALRHWVFESSVDGRKWVVLRQHVDDETINTAYGSGYWTISHQDDKGYRFVRVRQTGVNSTGRHALRLCGIEVYGKLVIVD